MKKHRVLFVVILFAVALGLMGMLVNDGVGSWSTLAPSSRNIANPLMGAYPPPVVTEPAYPAPTNPVKTSAPVLKNADCQDEGQHACPAPTNQLAH